MKKLHRLVISSAALAVGALVLCGAQMQGTEAAPATKSSIKVAVVNFKKCVEGSKLGKLEQANFEGMKKKMESSLEEKEKVITEMSKQLNDPDFLDTLSPEAETDLKRKFRALTQEMGQIQNQYYQTLSQANFKIVQKITEDISKASTEVAKAMNIEVILNEEGTFYHSDAYDVSKEVIAKMDELYDQAAQSVPATTTPATPAPSSK